MAHMGVASQLDVRVCSLGDVGLGFFSGNMDSWSLRELFCISLIDTSHYC